MFSTLNTESQNDLHESFMKQNMRKKHEENRPYSIQMKSLSAICTCTPHGHEELVPYQESGLGAQVRACDRFGDRMQL